MQQLNLVWNNMLFYLIHIKMNKYDYHYHKHILLMVMYEHIHCNRLGNGISARHRHLCGIPTNGNILQTNMPNLLNIYNLLNVIFLFSCLFLMMFVDSMKYIGLRLIDIDSNMLFRFYHLELVLHCCRN